MGLSCFVQSFNLRFSISSGITLKHFCLASFKFQSSALYLNSYTTFSVARPCPWPIIKLYSLGLFLTYTELTSISNSDDSKVMEKKKTISFQFNSHLYLCIAKYLIFLQ